MHAQHKQTRRTVQVETISGKSKGVPAEIWNLIKLSGDSQQLLVPHMVEYLPSIEGKFVTLQCEPLLNCMLENVV